MRTRIRTLLHLAVAGTHTHIYTCTHIHTRHSASHSNTVKDKLSENHPWSGWFSCTSTDGDSVWWRNHVRRRSCHLAGCPRVTRTWAHYTIPNSQFNTTATIHEPSIYHRVIQYRRGPMSKYGRTCIVYYYTSYLLWPIDPHTSEYIHTCLYLHTYLMYANFISFCFDFTTKPDE